MSVEHDLRALAGRFRIEAVAVDTDRAARRFAFRAVPPPLASGASALAVTEPVTSEEIRPGILDLTFVTKDVRFESKGVPTGALETEQIRGGMPIGAPPTGLGGPVPDTSGVPGTVGRIAGAVPIPVTVTTEAVRPVVMEFEWRFRDERGELTTARARAGGGTEAFGSTLFRSPLYANAGETMTVVFDAVFGELTTDTLNEPPTVERNVQLAVNLSAAGTSSGWVELPTIRVDFPLVAVPTVAVAFLDVAEGGTPLVILPGDSPFDESTLVGTGSALGALATLAGDATLVAQIGGGLGPTVARIASLLSPGGFAFQKADGISNLNEIDLIPGFLNDIEAEDELSSIVLFGPPRRRLECCNARNFARGEGRFDVQVGPELFTLVPNLHSNSPPSTPPGRVDVPDAPSGTRGLMHDITTFGDEVSSVRFGWS